MLFFTGLELDSSDDVWDFTRHWNATFSNAKSAVDRPGTGRSTNNAHDSTDKCTSAVSA